VSTPTRRTLIVGHGGREAALATRMAESSVLHAVMGHANPTITALVGGTGGDWSQGDVCDGSAIAQFAVANGIDIAMVSADDPLAAGVVDELRRAGIAAVGPTRAGAEIEWNKVFCREVVARVAPEANPAFAVARTVDEVDRAVAQVGAQHGPVVVKPVGLAGGKGVKVVGPHLADNDEAVAYAREVVRSGRNGGAVIIEERISAPEITIQAMTDGRTVVFPPATYDYPYRFDGDTGPGTGGMGSCALPGGLLPFVDAGDYDRACQIVQAVVDYLAEVGRPFSGCLNAGFFATADGLRVIECNARFGDPEGINIMALLHSDWVDAMEAMASQSFTASDVVLADQASVVTYLVAPEYAVGTSAGHRFGLDVEAVRAQGAHVLFSSAVAAGSGLFDTVGTSRAVAITAEAATIEEARATVERAIAASVTGDLQWRSDIGVVPGRVGSSGAG